MITQTTRFPFDALSTMKPRKAAQLILERARQLQVELRHNHGYLAYGSGCAIGTFAAVVAAEDSRFTGLVDGELTQRMDSELASHERYATRQDLVEFIADRSTQLSFEQIAALEVGYEGSAAYADRGSAFADAFRLFAPEGREVNDYERRTQRPRDMPLKDRAIYDYNVRVVEVYLGAGTGHWYKIGHHMHVLSERARQAALTL